MENNAIFMEDGKLVVTPKYDDLIVDDKFDILINNLDAIDIDKYLVISEDEEKYISNDNPNSKLINHICSDIFVGPSGTVRRAYVDAFNHKTNKYKVGPGEVDSFGWLTGVIIFKDVFMHCFG